MQRIVLAFSGGLESSVAVPWLVEHAGAEVVAVTLDLGQGRDLDHARHRAVAAGAVRAHVIDARDEFARTVVVPALAAGALDDRRAPLAAALSRPLIARHVAEIARMERATAVAHGARGDDARRFEALFRALDPALAVIAAARDRQATRSETLAWARARGFAAGAFDRECRSDCNLWGRMVAGPPSDTRSDEFDPFVLTRDPAGAPAEAAHIDLEFSAGVPVAVNGIPMPLVELVEAVATIAGAHGVGRHDVVSSAAAGVERLVHEAPAAAVLEAAHRELVRRLVAPDTARLQAPLAHAYAELVGQGEWFGATREAIDAFASRVQTLVTGAVRLRLLRGDCRVTGVTLPVPAVAADFAALEVQPS